MATENGGTGRRGNGRGKTELPGCCPAPGEDLVCRMRKDVDDNKEAPAAGDRSPDGVCESTEPGSSVDRSFRAVVRRRSHATAAETSAIVLPVC